MITEKIIENGIEKGIIRFITDPNMESGTVCSIGDNWFYFGGETAERMSPDQYATEVFLKDKVNSIMEVLNDFVKDETFHEEYDYYDYFLHEQMPEFANTKIRYLYRDGSNYKVHNSVIVSGIFYSDEIRTITSCLIDGEYFIPSQVGLPEKRFDQITEDDVNWFELYTPYCFEETNELSNVELTTKELVQKFLKAKNSWKF